MQDESGLAPLRLLPIARETEFGFNVRLRRSIAEHCDGLARRCPCIGSMMLYRKMGRSDVKLSNLGFGCMRLPTTHDGHVDEPLTTRMLHTAIDAGVNYVDTAYPYHNGESEYAVGKALADGYRQKVLLATKLPSGSVSSRGDMDRYLNEQLLRLQTDYIDLYLIHAIGADSWDRLDTLEIRAFMRGALTDGRIRHVGFSSHDTVHGIKHVIDSYEWDFCLLQYNFLDETYQAGTEGVAYAAQRGLGVMVMEPLRGGMLTRPLPQVMDVWSKAPTQRSLAQWALRWVWNHAEVTSVLSGMSDPRHVEENLRVALQGQPNTLSSEELALFETVKEVYRSKHKVDCTTCGYCMPCPNGVNIVECFAQYNAAFMFDDLDYARFVYNIRTASGGGASECLECGQCLMLCPQRIAVPTRLKQVVALFGK
jgi:uncharacterized protein